MKKKKSKNKKSENKFIKDTIQRGEASPKKNGDLPEGSTHEIVKYDKDGNPIIKRIRFSSN